MRDFDRSGPILAHLSEAQKKNHFFYDPKKTHFAVFSPEIFSTCRKPPASSCFLKPVRDSKLLNYLGTVLGAHLIPGSL